MRGAGTHVGGPRTVGSTEEWCLPSRESREGDRHSGAPRVTLAHGLQEQFLEAPDLDPHVADFPPHRPPPPHPPRAATAAPAPIAREATPAPRQQPAQVPRCDLPSAVQDDDVLANRL